MYSRQVKLELLDTMVQNGMITDPDVSNVVTYVAAKGQKEITIIGCVVDVVESTYGTRVKLLLTDLEVSNVFSKRILNTRNKKWEDLKFRWPVSYSALFEGWILILKTDVDNLAELKKKSLSRKGRKPKDAETTDEDVKQEKYTVGKDVLVSAQVQFFPYMDFPHEGEGGLSLKLRAPLHRIGGVQPKQEDGVDVEDEELYKLLNSPLVFPAMGKEPFTLKRRKEEESNGDESEEAEEAVETKKPKTKKRKSW